MKNRSILYNFLISFTLFYLSFFLTWQLSAANNFFYSTWYEVLNLDQTISKYAPNNKFKTGFEHTNKKQHVELFAGIVTAIQKNGEGLEALQYFDTESNNQSTLLTDAEVIHLRDVANLLAKISILAWVCLIVFVGVFVLMRFQNVNIARSKNHILGGLTIVLALTMLVLIIGPTKVFYLGHEILFPDKNQWFFYYEESLMSTMMKAPILFGPIAMQLLLVTIVIWITLLTFSKYILKKFC